MSVVAAAPRPRRHRPSAGPLLDYDVVVVGAGSAGLSAALVLGRSLRQVLVCDGGPPRNASSPGVQGFFTRDGTKPADLLHLGRAQLTPYASVEVRPARVRAIASLEPGFQLTLEGEAGRASTCTARKVLLATGVEDELPAVDGMREFWGTGVLHCPYCHGWEVRNQPLAVYGRGRAATGLALLVSRWSTDVVVCTDGPGHLTANARRRLRQQGIRVREEEVSRLEGTRRGELRHIVFATGEKLLRAAVFIHAHQHQRTPWPRSSAAGSPARVASGLIKTPKLPCPASMPPATPLPALSKPCWPPPKAARPPSASTSSSPVKSARGK